ncbi:hypothetical protein WICMUC_001665 [Wickerhamomyces mucosus]|uniref:CMP/dCMP-type deaminase domain-containing protein n=1 Tax=Wickerhamomyces mucosus TaxID=1378264 RepID=A0A9P8PVR1_9ASCO|nr:hypothetical protein WICMUC_001665 [Wickerhamomyces mucosus]
MVKKINNKLDIDFESGIIEKKLLQIVKKNPLINVLKLISVWTIEVDPKSSSKVLSVFKNFPDPVNLQHLKRIQKTTEGKLKVLVSSMELFSNENEVKLRLENESIVYQNLSIHEVPNHCPTIKLLSHDWTQKYWPLLWKGNPNDQILNDMKINVDEIRIFLERISKESLQITEGLPIVTLAAKDSKILAISSDKRSSSQPLEHSIMSCIETITSQQRKNDHDNTEQYLLNDITIYTTHEPCSMCCMALIHSRIQRLIYLEPSIGTGALKQSSGDGYCIHDNKFLNSSYEVLEWIGDEFQVGKVHIDIPV